MISQKIIIAVVLASLSLFANSAVVVPIQGTIDMGLPNFVQRSVDLAEEESSDYIIFDIDTFGGRVDAATQIKDIILSSQIPTIAFINRRAISAGALISLSCDSIYMTKGATIGAATAVDAQGEKASEKIISYMREEMAASAEANKRPRQIAEAMVDEEIQIDFILDNNLDTLTNENIEGFNKGKLITLSTELALKVGIADRLVDSMESLNSVLNIDDKEAITVDETWSELLVRFLTNPTVAPLLMSLGMLGLFFEIKSPGFGIPGGLGLLFLALFFGSHLLVGLADSSELLLLFAGIFLIVLEVFVIPGFGLIGIAGFLIILFSLFKMMIGEYPLPEDINLATRNMGMAFMSMLILGYFIFKSFTQSEYYKKLIPVDGQSSDDGYTISRGYDSLINSQGTTQTVLRPSGKIEINGKEYQAMSKGEFIEAGEAITIVGIDENQLIVKKV